MPTTLPQVPRKPVFDHETNPRARTPQEHDYDKGTFVNRLDGEPYALAIHEPDLYGRTHSLKNSEHFWQGTEDAFIAEFEKA